jgi:hypothetical protein
MAICGDGVAGGFVGVAGPLGIRVARRTGYRAVVVAMFVCRQLVPCAWGIGFGMGQPVVAVGPSIVRRRTRLHRRQGAVWTRTSVGAGQREITLRVARNALSGG